MSSLRRGVSPTSAKVILWGGACRVPRAAALGHSSCLTMWSTRGPSTEGCLWVAEAKRGLGRPPGWEARVKVGRGGLHTPGPAGGEPQRGRVGRQRAVGPAHLTPQLRKKASTRNQASSWPHPDNRAAPSWGLHGPGIDPRVGSRVGMVRGWHPCPLRVKCRPRGELTEAR